MSEQDSPIRIAQIIGKWLGGGVESVVMNYYRHIDRSKIQFDFICDEDSTNIPYDEINSLGGKVILIPPYQKVIKYHNELKKVLKDGNYKIVHSHINTLSVFSLFAAKSAAVPIRIAHSHSTTNKKEKKKNLLKQVLRPFSKVFATDYMCCSELAGRWLFGDKEYDKGNVYLLNNAIDLDKFKYDEKVRKTKRKELNIDDDTLVIGHVGRFVEQKNHRFLIEIFDRLKQKNTYVKLLLVGDGDGRGKIENLVKEKNLQEDIKFLGMRDDVYNILQAMDVFVFPSLYEGLPVTLIEAQSAGLPCIISDQVPLECKMSDLVYVKSLQESESAWVDEILKLSDYKRTDTTPLVIQSGYDIRKNAEKLQKYYLKLYRETE